MKTSKQFLTVASSLVVCCTVFYFLAFPRLQRNMATEMKTPPVSLNVAEYKTAETNRTERFHVVITFPLLTQGVTWTANDTRKHQRMMEYVHCLTRFLLNNNVKQVHMMYNSSEMIDFIKSYVGFHTKLKLHKVKAPDLVLTLHQFAWTSLQGEIVVITQADIILGENFEKVDKSLLMKQRMMYALSRHESPCGRQPNMCKKYGGSHDTFVFVPQGNLEKEAIKLLTHFVNNLGTENVVMHVYGKVLKYKILNPCETIKIYHFHCTYYRPNRRKRINKTHSKVAGPTSSLQ